jgi:hypothetical protein
MTGFFKMGDDYFFKLETGMICPDGDFHKLCG